jgi:hypothetical protein
MRANPNAKESSNFNNQFWSLIWSFFGVWTFGILRFLLMRRFALPARVLVRRAPPPVFFQQPAVFLGT